MNGLEVTKKLTEKSGGEYGYFPAAVECYNEIIG